MEKGKLIVIKTKKGFAGKIIFERNGMQKELPITVYKFTNDQLNGQDCTFAREDGHIIHITTESSGVLYNKEAKTKLSENTKNMRQLLNDSLDISKTRLPSDVKKLLEDIEDIDNFYLKLNKAARYEERLEKKEKFMFYHKGRKRGDISYEIHANFGNINYQDILERQQIHAQALFLDKQNYETLTFSPDWRLIVGLGGESVYETSMTLHHIYGIPYIPASTVKGVTRNYVINENFGNDEKNALKNNDFCSIFGSDDNSYDGKTRQGNIIFFDAFPTKLTNQSIQPDVINVHYPDYYGEEKPPTDTQNPNPIFFLTVQDMTFQFVIGIKPYSLLIEDKKSELLKKIENWLRSALIEHGIGAKTAVGYGYMQKL
jgi:CRISPR-associated protein Cmr6